MPSAAVAAAMAVGHGLDLRRDGGAHRPQHLARMSRGQREDNTFTGLVKDGFRATFLGAGIPAPVFFRAAGSCLPAGSVAAQQGFQSWRVRSLRFSCFTTTPNRSAVCPESEAGVRDKSWPWNGPAGSWGGLTQGHLGELARCRNPRSARSQPLVFNIVETLHGSATAARTGSLP
jgi:hypothetical protein